MSVSECFEKIVKYYKYNFNYSEFRKENIECATELFKRLFFNQAPSLNLPPITDTDWDESLSDDFAGELARWISTGFPFAQTPELATRYFNSFQTNGNQPCLKFMMDEVGENPEALDRFCSDIFAHTFDIVASGLLKQYNTDSPVRFCWLWNHLLKRLSQEPVRISFVFRDMLEYVQEENVAEFITLMQSLESEGLRNCLLYMNQPERTASIWTYLQFFKKLVQSEMPITIDNVKSFSINDWMMRILVEKKFQNPTEAAFFVLEANELFAHMHAKMGTEQLDQWFAEIIERIPQQEVKENLTTRVKGRLHPGFYPPSHLFTRDPEEPACIQHCSFFQNRVIAHGNHLIGIFYPEGASSFLIACDKETGKRIWCHPIEVKAKPVFLPHISDLGHHLVLWYVFEKQALLINKETGDVDQTIEVPPSSSKTFLPPNRVIAEDKGDWVCFTWDEAGKLRELYRLQAQFSDRLISLSDHVGILSENSVLRLVNVQGESSIYADCESAYALKERIFLIRKKEGSFYLTDLSQTFGILIPTREKATFLGPYQNGLILRTKNELLFINLATSNIVAVPTGDFHHNFLTHPDMPFVWDYFDTKILVFSERGEQVMCQTKFAPLCYTDGTMLLLSRY